jgi:hypothetical protein
MSTEKCKEFIRANFPHTITKIARISKGSIDKPTGPETFRVFNVEYVDGDGDVEEQLKIVVVLENKNGALHFIPTLRWAEYTTEDSVDIYSPKLICTGCGSSKCAIMVDIPGKGVTLLKPDLTLHKEDNTYDDGEAELSESKYAQHWKTKERLAPDYGSKEFAEWLLGSVVYDFLGQCWGSCDDETDVILVCVDRSKASMLVFDKLSDYLECLLKCGSLPASSN